MFRITKKGTAEIIAIVDEIRYITYDATSKTFCRAFGKDDADGIAVKGQVFNFGDTEKLEDYPFADISEVDGSALIERLQAEKTQLQTELAETQEALTEAYETAANAENELTKTQIAITELYERLEG